MNDAPNQWDDCPPGELCRLRKLLRAAAMKAQCTSALQCGTKAAALLLLVGFLGYQSFVWMTPGDMTCSACAAQFDNYGAHLAGHSEMNARIANQVADHLANCPDCRNKFEAKHPGLLPDTIKTAGLGLGFVLAAGLLRRR